MAHFIYLRDLSRGKDYESFVKKCIIKYDKKSTYSVHLFDKHKPIDADTEILLQILTKERNRFPVFLDAFIANSHPEILQSQSSIVILPHQQNFETFNEFCPFNESLCAQHSAYFAYENDEYVDINNTKNLRIIDVNSFKLDKTSFERICKNHEEEQHKFPVKYLSRYDISVCEGDVNELKRCIENRYYLSDNIGKPHDEDLVVKYENLKYVLSLVNTYSNHLTSTSKFVRRLVNQSNTTHDNSHAKTGRFRQIDL